jgi:hypothetical protein
MARVRLSALFNSIAGKYAGGVFRNWKGVTTLSAIPASVDNPASTKQAEARAIFGWASKKWTGLATQARDDWHSVAGFLTDMWDGSRDAVGERTVIYPPQGPYTALGALASVCGLLKSIGELTVEDAVPTAPVGMTAPGMVTDLAMSGDTAGIVVTWTDPSVWGDNASAGKVRIFFKSEDGTFHSQLAGAVDDGTETLTIDEGSGRQGSILDLVPGRYLVQADAVNAEGLRGSPSAVVELTIADPI